MTRERGGATVRMARWSATHPWRAVCAWVLFVALCAGAGSVVGTRTSDTGLATGEALRAARMEDGAGLTAPAVENVLITARSGALDRPSAQRAASDVRARLERLPQVTEVAEPVAARDGSALLVRATMAGTADDAGANVRPLLDATDATGGAYPALRVEEVGDASMSAALDTRLDGDFHKAELVSIPVTLAILLVAFGALLAAGVPVLLALSSVGAAIGLSALASQLVPATDVLDSVILLIGMAVGVDYSLFYLRRDREERALGRNRIDAVEIAAATSGHAVVVSGLAVSVAMCGMFVSHSSTFHSLAIGAILVVAVAVLGSVTVLPALLAGLGARLERPRVPLVWRLTARRQGEGRFWPAVLRPALRRPAATLALSVVALLAIAAPATGMRLKLLDDSDLPRTLPVMQSYDRLTAAFPGTGSSLRVVVRAPAAQAAGIGRTLTALAEETARRPLFNDDGPVRPRTSRDHTVTTVDLGVGHRAGTADAKRALDLLRRQLLPQALRGIPVAEHAVGGPVALTADFTDDATDAMPWAIGFVLLFTLVMLMAIFRSPVVALTAIVLNTLSAAASYGLLTLVFQHHWAEGMLGFHSNGAIVTWLPLFLFVVLFGLSMDYHIFVVSRIQELVRQGLPTTQAVARGITRSAGTVTSAAVVMVAVFAIFATLSTLDMKQLGVGLAAAILLDATVIRAVVLPAAMILLGRANWWTPRLLSRSGTPTAAVSPDHEPRRAVVDELR
ncbi:MMPL family transporter [Streptomyces sp. NPDC001068]|uniref:MMPL family transporter n=1 Tax=Streptomyces sp. NPDC001068 TaxID=3364544 RepID=UPI0036B04AB5